MNKSTITFRLKGKRECTSWGLKSGYAVKKGKEDEGAKAIGYFPGQKSIFVEDNEKREPEEVFFEFNDILSDPAVEIVVPVVNVNLVTYLKSNQHFNNLYEVYNEDAVAEEKTAGYDKIEKALSLIRETDDFKIQAIALSILGQDAYGWTAIKCSAALKEKAVTSPDVIISKMEADNYESKYLSALAFFSGIVKEDNTNSSVVWNDENQGTVLRLAKGENGIQKLSELVTVSNDESRLILQEIGIRLDKMNATKVEDKKVVEATIVTGKTEAELRAEITAELTANTKSEADIRAEVMAELAANAIIPEPVVLVVKTDATFDATDLIQVQAKYKEVTGEDAPPRFKNDLKWLNTKIVEKEI